MNLEDFSVSVAWSDEEQQFVATVAEFPTVSAHGSTRERALAVLAEALEGCAAGMGKIGLRPPKGK